MAINDENRNSTEENKSSENTPVHDSFFAKAMSNLEVARDFLTQNLPAPLLEAVDLSSIVVCQDKYISHNLDANYTDILYQLKLKGENKDICVYTLTEHQSSPQKHMPLRVAYYEALIMQKYWENHKKVPLIHTIVYYNGNKPWNYPVDIKKMIDAPLHLIEQYALQPFQLMELNRIEDAELRKHTWAGVMGMVMKHIYGCDILSVLEGIKDTLQHIHELKGDEFIESILYYTYKRGQISDEERFKTFTSELTEEKFNMASLSEKHEALGFQKGIHLGIHQGEAAILLKQLQYRFGQVSPMYQEKVQKADENTLLKWSRRIFDAKVLEDVFVQSVAV